jgi:hypothetical protein
MDDLTYLVATPPRCAATRTPRLLEWARFILFGRGRGFDPTSECRCNLYTGHGDFGYCHEDVTNFKWAGDGDD